MLHKHKIDVLTLTETQFPKGKKIKFKNYKTFWGYSDHPEPGVRAKGGVAIIIKNNKFEDTFESFKPKKTHKNIIWIRWTTKTQDLYIAAVYSTPGKPSEHTKLLDILEDNMKEIGKEANIILTGDLNSSLLEVGGKTNPYGDELQRRIESNNLNLITPPPGSQHFENYSWEMQRKNKTQRSSPDHIITRPAAGTALNTTHRTTHRKDRIGSDHCLISAQIQIHAHDDPTPWTKQTWHKPDWKNEEVQQKYKDRTEDQIKAWITKWEKIRNPNDEQMEEATRDLIHILIENAPEQQQQQQQNRMALDSDKKRKRNTCEHKATSDEKTIKKLRKTREALYEKLHGQTDTEPGEKDQQRRAAILGKISGIQTDLEEHTRSAQNNNKRQWLSTIIDQARSHESSIFKLVAEARSTEKNKPPTVLLRPDGTIAKGKHDLLKVIQEHYANVPKTKDKEGERAQGKLEKELGPAASHIRRNLAEAQEAIQAQEQLIQQQNLQEEKIQQEPENGTQNRTDISTTEITRELGRTNNNKATGPDEISYEHIKYAHIKIIEALTILYSFFWRTGKIPKELKKTYLTILYKKGPRENVKSFRPITLLSVIMKLYEKCLETRLKDKLQLTNQIHFLQGIGHEKSGTTEMTLAATEIIQYYRKKKKKNIILTALDLSKGFDRVPRELLWKSLLDCGIKGKLWQALKSTYTDVETHIKIQGTIAEEGFQFTGGIKQGSPLSPLLYIIYMKKLLTELEKTKTGPVIGNTQFPALGYMDDLLLMARSTKEMKKQAKCVKRVALEWGFVINSGKTQILSYKDKKQTLAAARKIWGTTSLNHTIKYLGVHIQPTNDFGTQHWKERLKKALDAYHMLKGAGMKWGEMDYLINLKLYEHVIKPIIFYGCETTTPSNTILRKIDSIQARIMKDISGARRNTKNLWVLWETDKQTARTIVEEKKLRIAMKILKAPNESLIGRIRKEMQANDTDLYIIREAKEIAKLWETTSWLDEEDPAVKTSKIWKQEKNTAVRQCETRRYKTWSKPAGVPNRYDDIKPWHGINDIITGMEDEREARTILRARANRIGVGADPTPNEEKQTEQCTQCNKGLRDTLEHALWECENPQNIQARDIFHFNLEHIYENNSTWDDFEHDEPENKTRRILTVMKSPDETQEDQKIRAWEELAKLLHLIQEQRNVKDY